MKIITHAVGNFPHFLGFFFFFFLDLTFLLSFAVLSVVFLYFKEIKFYFLHLLSGIWVKTYFPLKNRLSNLGFC